MNRLTAKKEYDEALKEWNLASSGNCEIRFNNADLRLSIARVELVKFEIANPTYKETKKQNEILRLRNRGLDI